MQLQRYCNKNEITDENKEENGKNENGNGNLSVQHLNRNNSDVLINGEKEVREAYCILFEPLFLFSIQSVYLSNFSLDIFEISFFHFMIISFIHFPDMPPLDLYG